MELTINEDDLELLALELKKMYEELIFKEKSFEDNLYINIILDAVDENNLFTHEKILEDPESSLSINLPEDLCDRFLKKMKSFIDDVVSKFKNLNIVYLNSFDVMSIVVPYILLKLGSNNDELILFVSLSIVLSKIIVNNLSPKKENFSDEKIDEIEKICLLNLECLKSIEGKTTNSEINKYQKELEKYLKAMKGGNDMVMNKIFIVHGHNNEMKESVARLIEKIGYEAIILHEQPNRGRTIIEKFEDYSDVPFAIILYSPDDNMADGKVRARQNVIFEHGFFIGKLGRENVVALHNIDREIEILSDLSGVIYIPFDSNWKNAIINEMIASGLTVDKNKI